MISFGTSFKTLCRTACFACVCYCCDEQSVLAGFVNWQVLRDTARYKMDDSSFNLDISVGNVQECPPQRRNIYGSVVSAYFRIDIIVAVRLSTIASFLQSAESVPAPEGNAREPIGEEPNRSFCDCKSACKTKQKNGVGRGCPCRTANLPCVQNRCKCGTGRKQCANRVKSFYCVYAYTLDMVNTFYCIFL